MKGNIWLMSVLIIVLVVGSLAVAGLVSSASSPEHITDENLTLDSNGTLLAEVGGAAQLYQNETITVGNSTNRTELDRGADYTIDYDSGIVEPNSSQYNGTDALVNYSISQPDNDRTVRIASLLSLLNPIWAVLILLAILATTWSLVSGWW